MYKNQYVYIKSGGIVQFKMFESYENIELN